MAISIDDLYYQDMITNNYTSNMLGSVLGSSSASGNENSIVSILSTLSGIGGQDVSGLLSGTSGISSTSFSNILEQYMKTATTETEEASKWADTLEDVLEEVERTGDHSKSTATVQELYDYFQEKMASGANGISSLVHTNSEKDSNASVSTANNTTMLNVENGILDEAAIEAEIESSIESSIVLAL